MSAAAMFSLCAKADTLLGGIDFETGYSAGDSISVDASDPDTQSLHFWTGDAGESTIAADENTANKYLKVDTTAPLVRQTATNASEIAAVEIGTGDITVSSKVQFTAADEAPEITTGDEIITPTPTPPGP